jgi:hypothetical protein
MCVRGGSRCGCLFLIEAARGLLALLRVQAPGIVIRHSWAMCTVSWVRINWNKSVLCAPNHGLCCGLALT